MEAGLRLDLLQQQQRHLHHHAWFGHHAVIDRIDAGIGHQMAGQGKFMVGQLRDKAFARSHRLCPVEIQRHFMPAAGKCDAGPGLFGMRQQIGAPEDISYVKTPIRGRKRGDWVDVPRLDVGASAGPGALPQAEAAFDAFRFSRRWLSEQGLDGAQLSAITVEGDSMEPLLRDGDEILVDRAPRPFRDGVHVVRLGDTLMVKRVASTGAGRLALLSQNLAYPPVEVSADEVEIVGRVVWKGGRI